MEEKDDSLTNYMTKLLVEQPRLHIFLSLVLSKLQYPSILLGSTTSYEICLLRKSFLPIENQSSKFRGRLSSEKKTNLGAAFI